MSTTKNYSVSGGRAPKADDKTVKPCSKQDCSEMKANNKKIRVYVIEEENATYKSTTENIQPEHEVDLIFPSKVMHYVAVQLLTCTALITFLTLQSDAMEFFLEPEGHQLGLLCFLVWYGLFLVIGCCKVGLSESKLTTMALLILSSILLSTYTASVLISYNISDVLIPILATGGMLIMLVLMSLYSKFAIRDFGSYILVVSLSMFFIIVIVSIEVWSGVLLIQPNVDTMVTITKIGSGVAIVVLALAIVYFLKAIYQEE